MRTIDPGPLTVLSVHLLLLGACGGGSEETSGADDGTSAPASVAGIYAGQYLYRCDVVQQMGFVTDQGEFHLSEGYVGKLTANGSQFTSSLNGYHQPGPSSLTHGRDASSQSGLEIEAVVPGSNISMSLPYDAEPPCTQGTVVLDYQRSLYERPASLAHVASVYSIDWGAYAFTIALTSDGRVTGSDTDGCVLNGTLTVPHANRNEYLLTTDVDSCPSRGEYHGGAILIDSADGVHDDVLLLSLVNVPEDLRIYERLSR